MTHNSEKITRTIKVEDLRKRKSYRYYNQNKAKKIEKIKEIMRTNKNKLILKEWQSVIQV